LAPRIRKELRGRPRGISNKDYTVLESMAFIARKYDLPLERLIDSLLEAFEGECSTCGNLIISRRKLSQTSATFLISKDEKVVWQFPFNIEILKSESVRNSLKDIPLPQKINNDKPVRNLTIEQLRYGMKGINVLAKIIEIPTPQEVITKWGAIASVSNIKIADKTGSIKLTLWNDQIKLFNIGDEVEINNCKVSRFANETQLKLSRSSSISVINQNKAELKEPQILK